MLDKIPGREERSARTGFSANPLDRLSAHRDDADFIARLGGDPDARSVVIATDRPLLRRLDATHDPFFSLAEVAALGAARETALLGRTAAGPVFATLLDDAAVEVVQVVDDGTFVDRRTIVVRGHDHILLPDMRLVAMQGLVDPANLGILGQAKSLMYWHSRHRFCSNCGAPTRVAAAGWRRECDACKAQHFPRTDPVVIMLAVDGDRCLLGRQARFPKGMYSALAGFVEAGETIEDAVRREIFEEAGIGIGRVAYTASQPWPFPCTLMMGCLARAASNELTVDTVELEDARWFSREETRAMLASRHPDRLMCPPPMAIAHSIMNAWAVDGEEP